MFSPRVLVAIIAFAFTALATNSTCWYVLPLAYFMLASKWQWSGQIANPQLRVGNIGEPCYDHGNGCSLTGAMVSFSHSLHSFAPLPWPIIKRRSSSSHANAQIPGVEPEDGSSLF